MSNRKAKTIELCIACDEPTMRGGKGDDSIYCPGCHSGPLCPDCLNDECDGCRICDKSMEPAP